jgi:hypothetical protein
MALLHEWDSTEGVMSCELGQVLSHIGDLIARLFCFVGLKWHIAADQKLAPSSLHGSLPYELHAGRKQAHDLICTICITNPWRSRTETYATRSGTLHAVQSQLTVCSRRSV